MRGSRICTVRDRAFWNGGNLPERAREMFGAVVMGAFRDSVDVIVAGTEAKADQGPRSPGTFFRFAIRDRLDSGRIGLRWPDSRFRRPTQVIYVRDRLFLKWLALARKSNFPAGRAVFFLRSCVSLAYFHFFPLRAAPIRFCTLRCCGMRPPV